MHISSPQSNSLILNDGQSFDADELLRCLVPSNWPISLEVFPAGTALVGGSIRDVILGRDSKRQDLDFVIPSSAIDFTKSLVHKIGGTFVLLDPVRDIARLVVKGWNLDIATQCGDSLVDDLLRRDFTVNAIALKFAPTPLLIDPSGGLEDLQKKLIKAVSEQNLIDDPLRCLRGLRLMAELQFSLEEKTEKWIKSHHKLLKRSAPERVQAEVITLVKANEADKAIRLVDKIGLLRRWQSNCHDSSRKFPSLDCTKIFTPYERDLALFLCRLNFLLSDEGLERLRFSRKLRERCRRLRKWQHKDDGSSFLNLSEVQRLQLHKDLEHDLPAILLKLDLDQQLAWLKRWRNIEDPLFHPSSPIDGHFLQKSLDIPSGIQLGHLIGYLCHEKAFGRLNNRDEALQAARYWLVHNKTSM